MKFIKQLEQTRREHASKEKVYFNVVFHERFGPFLEALRTENLIRENQSFFTVERGFCWSDDVKLGGVKMITDDIPLIGNKTNTMIIEGTPHVIELFDHVISRYATFCLREDIEPEDVDYKPEYHEHLNPALWEKHEQQYTLKPEVRKGLWEIAEQFLKFLKMPQMEIADIIVTGSSANYNWTKQSDIDLHVVVDISEAQHKYGDIVPEYFETKRRLWNEQHDITVWGYPVEMYVQDEQEPHVATGMYSLKQEQWIAEPKYEKPRYDALDLKTKAAKFANEIEDMTATNRCNPVHAQEMMEKLRKYRKAGLAKGGEFSVENLVFKFLRSNGYLQKLSDCKRKGFDDSLSIEDEEWWKDETE